MRTHTAGGDAGGMFRRRRPTLRTRLGAVWLNVLAAVWAVRIVWCLSHGRLPASRAAKRRRSISRA